MLAARPTVFLSCSERFKEQVATPIKAALAEAGLNPIIVSDEAIPPGVSWEPDAKVEFFLDGSDAVVALCTPDDTLEGGTIQARQNIIDEMQRARQKSHLARRIYVLKADSVQLPSNINPTYARLDVASPVSAVDGILTQLEAWGVLKREAPSPVSTADTDAGRVAEELVTGLALGDHEEARRRVYERFPSLTKGQQAATVGHLVARMTDCEPSDDNTPILVAASVLEAANRIDLTLVSDQVIERMTVSSDFSVRSSAAVLLWDRAIAAPGLVPLDLLSRLAKPASEDWYVASPAMATVKVLALARVEAIQILERLAASSDADDRAAVAGALRELASLKPEVVSSDLVDQLLADSDKSVASSALEIAAALAGEQDGPKVLELGPFGSVWSSDVADVLESATKSAFTGAWRQTSSGLEATPLMNLMNTSMPPHDMPPVEGPQVRLGLCVAAEALSSDSSSSKIGAALIGLLNAAPISAIVTDITGESDRSWVRLAGNGVYLVEAILTSADAGVAAAAVFIPPIAGFESYGRDERVATLWLQMSPSSAAPLRAWHAWLVSASGCVGVFAEFLSSVLGLTTANEPSARWALSLQGHRSLDELVDWTEFSQLPGSGPSNQFIGYSLSDEDGEPAGAVASDLLRQLCDHTLHLADFDDLLDELRVSTT